MGIKGGTGNSWFQVVHKNRTDEAERAKKGLASRFTPVKVCSNPENIKTSKAAEEIIASRYTPKDEAGLPLPSTDRGKRRRAKRQGK